MDVDFFLPVVYVQSYIKNVLFSFFLGAVGGGISRPNFDIRVLECCCVGFSRSCLCGCFVFDCEFLGLSIVSPGGVLWRVIDYDWASELLRV